MTSTFAVVSGGMDSTTLAYDLAESGDLAGIISFDYGQRHRVELDKARATADRLNVPIMIQEVPMIVNSALTNMTIDVPDGHYAEASMEATVVPNRNLTMISIAAGLASSAHIGRVAVGVHSGDHFVYPDCRPEFIAAATTACFLGTGGQVRLVAPYIDFDKAGIASIGVSLGVDFDAVTWSCYKGGEIHCGRCGTCVERLEALDAVGYRIDVDQYEDVEYWRAAIAEYTQ